MLKIAVIGAGFSGAVFAYFLNQHADVTIFEKSRGLGGRMSTRIVSPYAFDHGAQYFTAKTPVFNTFIQTMLQKKIIARWNALIVKIDNPHFENLVNYDLESPIYVGVPQMNNLVKYLCQDISVKLNTQVELCKKTQNKWELFNKDQQPLGCFDWVVCTAPAVQTKALLNNYLNNAELTLPKMSACFALLLGFKEHVNLEFDAAHVVNQDISWIANNHSKPGRNKYCSIVVHSSHSWAQQHLELDIQLVTEHLEQELLTALGSNLPIVDYKAVHRWKYASVEPQQGKNYFINSKNQLAICGDWFMQGRIESAFISALELSQQIKYYL